MGGSLSTATYSTGTNNELTSDGTYSYTYDNDGNMTAQTEIATGSVTYYNYDYENRLTEVKEETSGGTVIEDQKFTYDVFGNQIGMSLNGTQQLYTVFDGSNPYIDFNGSGSVTERYLTNPTGLNQFYGEVSPSGTTNWFLTDNLGSIRQVVSSSGSVLDTITYDPYGNILSQTSSTYAPRFLYAGGAYDSITDNYQFDARYYSPVDGRWDSQDPLGLGPDSDPYRYVSNDPTILSDPTGRDVEGKILVWYIRYTDGKFAGKKISLYKDGSPTMRGRLELPIGEAKVYIEVKITNDTECTIWASVWLVEQFRSSFPPHNWEPRVLSKEAEPVTIAAGNSAEYPQSLNIVIRSTGRDHRLLAIGHYWNQKPDGRIEGLGGHLAGIPFFDAEEQYFEPKK